jgi:hypothetical protein
MVCAHPEKLRRLMKVAVPPCRKCNNFWEPKRRSTRYRCNAYPDGIPIEVWLGYVSHTKTYKNDNGILFAPADR